MKAIEKINYENQIETYLQQQQIPFLMQTLMKNLVIDQPDDPIKYLIDSLQIPPNNKIFIVCPPGIKSNRNRIFEDLSENLRFNFISCGKLLREEIKKQTNLGKQINSQIKDLSYVKDDIVNTIVIEELKRQIAQKKDFILEGFPRTRTQGLALQMAGIIPDSFIILESDKAENYCLKKINENEFDYSYIDQSQACQHVYKEYMINIRQVKDIYQGFYQEVQMTDKKNQLLEDIQMMLKLKISKGFQNKKVCIVVIGPKCSGKTELTKAISNKFGIKYISVTEMLKSQIQKKTELGQAAKYLMNKGQMVPDDIIFGMLLSKVKKPQYQKQGFILEGFPKTIAQFNNLQDLKIQNTLYVFIDSELQFIQCRSGGKKDMKTGIIYTSSDEVSAEVQDRLVDIPNSSIDEIQKSHVKYEKFKKEIKQQTSQDILSCKAKDSIQTKLDYVQQKMMKFI